MHSVCPFVCRWYDVDSFVFIPNMLFNSFVISAANYGSLSDIILFSNPCNFYILFLNNLTNPSADVSSVVVTKCVILDNLSQTTRISSFLAINFSFSDIYYILPHITPYFSLLLATNNSLLLTLLSSTFLYIQLLVYHDITKLSLLLILIRCGSHLKMKVHRVGLEMHRV